MEINTPEFGIAGVWIPMEFFDEGLYDYLYEKAGDDTAFYLLKLLKADKDAQNNQPAESTAQKGRT